MAIDPLIDEIRSHRREIEKEYNSDLDLLCDALRAMEAEHPYRVVRGAEHAPRRPAADGADSKPETF